MRISVFFDHIREASQQTGQPLEDVLRQVRGMGITALECSLESLTEDVKGRKALFDACGMTVSSIYGMYDFANTRDTSLAYPLIDTAAFFGADKVLVVPGFTAIDEENPAAATRAVGTPAMEQMAEVLNALCAYAGARHITVTMEDFDDAHAPFASEVQLKWFLEQVTELKICFDTGNFLYADVEELAAFEVLKQRIAHVHCKDRSLVPDERETPKLTVTGKALYASPVGSGCIRMEEVIRRLLAMGYDDTLAVEHFGAQDQLLFMEQSAAFLQEVLWKNGRGL
jgi:sugar phosphate isomerase/epimerase